MPTSNYPTNFLRGLPSVSKMLNMVFEIEGVSAVYAIQATFRKWQYGDPYIYGNNPLLYYNARVQVGNNKLYISDKSTMTISQRIEPEQGRASTSTFSVVLIDKNAEISSLVGTAGSVVSEIMGRACKILVGFADTNYPSDYYVAFRGVITNIQTQSGQVTFTVGDANQKRRQAIFKVQKTLTTSLINSSTLTIPVVDAADFYQPILGPDGTFDSNVSLFCTLENETVQYSTSTTTQINAVTRGARGTLAASHNASTEVTHTCQITGHPLTLALKMMLSGWGGPFQTGIPPQAVGTNLVPLSGVTNAICLPATKNAKLDYGLTVGDWVTISGSTLGNNGTYQITGIEDGLEPDNVLRIATSLTLETGGTLALALRSKYDTLPVGMGIKLSPKDVDVAGHEELRDIYLSDSVYNMSLYVNAQQVGKDYIESQIYLPIGCYSLTRYGQLSVNQTRAPIATASLQILNLGNIIDAENITNNRGLNTRKFFNSIQFQYDVLDDNSTYTSVLRSLDTNSLNLIGITSLLPLQSQGLKTSLGAATLISKVSLNLLNRYKRGAFEIALKTNFQVGARIEAGDVVAVQDNGYLQITDFNTGARNIGTQLYEVTDRTMDLKTGQVTLKLVSGITGSASDRFGTVSPSSIVSAAAPSTATSIRVDSSYNPSGTADETTKWRDYIGQPIRVRNEDYSVIEDNILISVSNASVPYTLNLASPLSFTPLAGYICEIPPYPTSTSSGVNALYKAVHCFTDPIVTVVSGISAFSFTVSALDIVKFHVNTPIYVRKDDFSVISPSVVVSAVNTTTNTVTVVSSLGFTPVATDKVELIGFADSGAGYRIYG
ncbi:hypothetical protein EBZ39_05645 [bacterium]|nr:hypothetical protein [bacterium]